MTTLSLRGALVLGALTFAGALGAAQTVADAWMQDAHSLQRNGRWRLSKLDLTGPLPGAVSMWETATPLRFDKLDLGAWSGYQEVLLADPVELRRFVVGFEIPDDRCLHLVWSKTDAGASGVRLSTSERLPSMGWTTDADGLFLDSTPIATNLERGWNRAIVEVEDGRWTLSVNDVEVLGGESVPLGRVGVRGCLDSTWVDDVRVRAQDLGVVAEDWDPRGRQLVFAAALGLLLAGGLLLGGLLWLVLRRPVVLGLVLVLAYVVVAAAATGWAIQDQRRWGHPSEEEEPDRPDEVAPHAVTDTLQAAHPRGADAQRILVVGTGQVAGQGADRGLVPRLCDALDGGWECMAAGLPGSSADELFKLTRDQWIHHAPAVIVVLLGARASDLRQYERGLVRFAELAAARGIPLVLATEPMSPEAGLAFRADRQDLTRGVAERFGLPLVDLQARLFARRNDGLLWWDLHTLTAAGHQVVAEELARELRPLLEQ